MKLANRIAILAHYRAFLARTLKMAHYKVEMTPRLGMSYRAL
ncbi:hypothetical protein [Bartonella sp. LJL80]